MRHVLWLWFSFKVRFSINRVVLGTVHLGDTVLEATVGIRLLKVRPLSANAPRMTRLALGVK